MFAVCTVMVSAIAISCSDKKKENNLAAKEMEQDNSVPSLESVYAMLQDMGSELKAPGEMLLSNTGLAQVYDKTTGEGANSSRRLVFAKNATVNEDGAAGTVYESKGEHGCVLEITKSNTIAVSMMFRDSLDADDFYQQMVKRGMLRDEKDGLFLTNGKIGAGIKRVTTDELKNKYHATFHVSKPEANGKREWFVGKFDFCQ